MSCEKNKVVVSTIDKLLDIWKHTSILTIMSFDYIVRTHFSWEEHSVGYNL